MKAKQGKLISAVLLSFMLMFVVSPVALAQVTGEGPQDLTAIGTILTYITSWFQGIVLTVGVIMIIAAGLVWMTAGGNDDKLTTARKMLVWGLIGIAVALFAYVAETFIKSII